MGRTFEVLVEGPSRRGRGQWFGRTRGNKPVVFEGGGELGVGELVAVRIGKATAATLVGTVEKTP
jgi:tRNA-2-methylthio-N6-dimethylallyladenosine synthase